MIATRRGDPGAAFRSAYAEHRKAEGRAYSTEELHALPYLEQGPLAAQWSIRARSFDTFRRRVLDRSLSRLERPVDVLDIGAGNGWLCHRVAQSGHNPVAFDFRADEVDGLGAAAAFARSLGRAFPRICGSFDSLPFRGETFDLVVFGASLHYALDLAGVLGEAARVARRGGRVVILDSPFYRSESDGEAMVVEKRAAAAATFGASADTLMSLPFIEFLTRERLATASSPLGLRWRRHRVLYPLRYEMRPLQARIGGRRAPSRFDVWEATVP